MAASTGLAERLARLALLAGPVAGVALALVTHPAVGARGGVSEEAACTLGLLAWMVIWWMSEAVPLAVTSLLPVVVLPIAGVGSFRDNAMHYADGIIFLFAGAGVIAAALERHGVTRRFAGSMLRLAGPSPVRNLVAMFLVTAVASAFMSNAAVTAMMLPIALGLAATARPTEPGEAGERARRHFGMAVLLSAAYASTVGGAATLIGSPPNAIAAKWLAEAGHPVDFAGWARFGVPLSCLVGVAAIAVLVRLHPMHGLRCAHAKERPVPLAAPAWIAISVFACTVLAWVSGPAWPAGLRTGLGDGAIAIVAAIALCALPCTRARWEPVVPWSDVERLPWGVYILFGGGLSLADAMQRTGLSEAIGQSFAGLGTLPALAALGSLVAALVFTSEVASNTALTATAVPIVGALAPSLGVPVERLVIATALGASYAFMLPVGTPPNAMVYATGLVPQRTMMRAGLALNIISIVLVTLVAHCML
ncbi:MAG: SLC13 family permease [Planctomycetota bacterium]